MNPLPGNGSTAAAFWTLMVVLSPAGIGSAQQSSQTSEEPRLACSSGAPIVGEGTSIALRAWALSKSGIGTAQSYAWTVDAGKIGGAGREVQWDFSGVPWSPQPHRATVNVTFPSGTTASCSVQVRVVTGQRGGRIPARSFLVKGKPVVPGYGLYSYFLLGSRPTGSSRERYLAAIQAYLAAMEDVADYGPPAAILNVAYLPIAMAAPPDFTAEWLLGNYDYARAQTLLHALPGDLTDGPYIVSTLKPLDFDTRPSQYLFQNLSIVPTKPSELISWWVREFIHQSAQERFWEPKTAELLALKLRTTIAVLAIGLPEVQGAVASWVSWKH